MVGALRPSVALNLGWAQGSVLFIMFASVASLCALRQELDDANDLPTLMPPAPPPPRAPSARPQSPPHLIAQQLCGPVRLLEGCQALHPAPCGLVALVVLHGALLCSRVRLQAQLLLCCHRVLPVTLAIKFKALAFRQAVLAMYTVALQQAG